MRWAAAEGLAEVAQAVRAVVAAVAAAAPPPPVGCALWVFVCCVCVRSLPFGGGGGLTYLRAKGGFFLMFWMIQGANVFEAAFVELCCRCLSTTMFEGLWWWRRCC